MLEVDDLSVRYGARDAVHGVSLRLAPGEAVALIGGNGAGTSSVLRAVAGAVRPSAGRVRLFGENVAGLAPHQIVRRGAVLVPEGRMIFTQLSVRENLLLGAHSAGSGGAARTRLDDVLPRFPTLQARLDAPGASLSGGERQLLAVARGLMARPKLIMLDEPSLGLSPKAMHVVFALIAELVATGLGVLLVEQNVRQALALARRGYVLQSGRIVLSGASAALLGNALLRDAYLGASGGAGGI
jgi:branched-chain amino acid transport system ATP-binding protein